LSRSGARLDWDNVDPAEILASIIRRSDRGDAKVKAECAWEGVQWWMPCAVDGVACGEGGFTVATSQGRAVPLVITGPWGDSCCVRRSRVLSNKQDLTTHGL
jgi:hypothetical protein